MDVATVTASRMDLGQALASMYYQGSIEATAASAPCLHLPLLAYELGFGTLKVATKPRQRCLKFLNPVA